MHKLCKSVNITWGQQGKNDFLHHQLNSCRFPWQKTQRDVHSLHCCNYMVLFTDINVRLSKFAWKTSSLSWEFVSLIENTVRKRISERVALCIVNLKSETAWKEQVTLITLTMALLQQQLKLLVSPVFDKWKCLQWKLKSISTFSPHFFLPLVTQKQRNRYFVL